MTRPECLSTRKVSNYSKLRSRKDDTVRQVFSSEECGSGMKNTTGVPMPEVIFNGPAGRLEGRYQPSKEKSAPIAIILHPHPQFGGTMNNQIVYQLFYLSRSAVSRRSGSTSAPSAVARASSTMAPASFPTLLPLSTGCRACIPIRKAAGSPVIPSAPGSACSC